MPPPPAARLAQPRPLPPRQLLRDALRPAPRRVNLGLGILRQSVGPRPLLYDLQLGALLVAIEDVAQAAVEPAGGASTQSGVGRDQNRDRSFTVGIHGTTARPGKGCDEPLSPPARSPVAHGRGVAFLEGEEEGRLDEGVGGVASALHRGRQLL